ncbi:MAG: hypothetical protein ABSG97_04740 [Sedimentisphaerales bacterium]|jgi:hypothetical protein
MRRKQWWILFPLFCLLGYASFAQATAEHPLYVFNRDVPKLNISVQSVDAGVGLVDFVFSNNSTVKNSSITHIYFDDEAGLFSTVVAIFGEGMTFHTDKSTRDLPGGENLNPLFETTDGFSLSANFNNYRNGINPGESTVVTIGLLQGYDFGDVASALGSGQLRVGVSSMRTSGGGCGGRDGRDFGSGVVAVNVPLPATGILFGFGTVLLRKFGRKTGNRTQQVSYPGEALCTRSAVVLENIKINREVNN